MSEQASRGIETGRRPVHVPLDGVVECAAEQMGPVALGRRMARTMRFTFAVAQGDTGSLHKTIIKLAAGKCRSLYGAETVSAAAATVDDAELERLRLPGNGRHSKNLIVGGKEPETPTERKDLIARQFRSSWRFGPNTFTYELTNRMNLYEPGNEEFDGLLLSLVNGMMRQDAGYLNPEHPGRPDRGQGRDPRQSFVRDFMLLGQTIGDPIIDAVLSDAREVVLNRDPGKALVDLGNRTYVRSSEFLGELYSSRMPALAAQWEAYHPGQVFMDQGVIAGTRLAIPPAPPLAS